MDHLKLKGTIQLGNLSARIVEDAQGRQCAAIVLGDREVLFTVTHALMVRELLDASLRVLAEYKPALEGTT